MYFDELPDISSGIDSEDLITSNEEFVAEINSAVIS